MKFWQAMKIVDEGGKVRRDYPESPSGYIAKSINLGFEGSGVSFFDPEGNEYRYQIRTCEGFPDLGNWYDMSANDWIEVDEFGNVLVDIDEIGSESVIEADWESQEARFASSLSDQPELDAWTDNVIDIVDLEGE